ncbi:Gustatory receptor [Aphis craccivora]|uniref:Gustatory receptor n=1 Tax=Aphis craccivora TaxID=307492 RepID=A0A6G0XCH8_APHCR|nr:Gustatory receptor [Aphis craccivora]
MIDSLCYFLHNLHARFWTLNDLWKCLPAELVVEHDQWTHIEIVFFMEKTRLLHSELCKLLKKFTIGFGPLLLAFFTFNFISLFVGIFFVVTKIHSRTHESSAAEMWDQIFNVTSHIQIVIFMMSIIVYVSFIEDQIKMFMNQMSVSGLDQITAFGFFDVNLNLVTSVNPI